MINEYPTTGVAIGSLRAHNAHTRDPRPTIAAGWTATPRTARCLHATLCVCVNLRLTHPGTNTAPRCRSRRRHAEARVAAMQATLRSLPRPRSSEGSRASSRTSARRRSTSRRRSEPMGYPPLRSRAPHGTRARPKSAAQFRGETRLDAQRSAGMLEVSCHRKQGY